MLLQSEFVCLLAIEFAFVLLFALAWSMYAMVFLAGSMSQQMRQPFCVSRGFRGRTRTITTMSSLFFFFILFIMFTTFGVMNVIIGVIVDNTMEAARTNESDVAKKLMLKRVMLLEKLRNACFLFDEDQNGEIDIDELRLGLQNQEIARELDDEGIEVVTEVLTPVLQKLMDQGELCVKQAHELATKVATTLNPQAKISKDAEIVMAIVDEDFAYQDDVKDRVLASGKKDKQKDWLKPILMENRAWKKRTEKYLEKASANSPAAPATRCPRAHARVRVG